MSSTAEIRAASPLGHQDIPLIRIDESPHNPRKDFDTKKLSELAASILELGVVSPILVRPKGDRFEVVYGHRRKRAAELAKFVTIPAIVRELDDREALEVAILENCQRADIHPIEEGAAYAELHEAHGLTVDEIAAKVGKSRATIYARLKLCSMVESARKAVLEGKLDASIGLLIARIPSAKLQIEATKDLLAEADRDDGDLSFRRASWLVQRKFMLRLADAPFSPTDATLVPSAGACGPCPKRTGSQPGLFDDVDSADVCTDTACFASKRDAAWKARKAEAEAKGLKVLSDKAAKDLFPYGGANLTYGSELVDFDGEEWDGSSRVKLRDLAKKLGAAPEVTLVRDPLGNPRELISKGAATALMRKAKPPAKKTKADEERAEENAKHRDAAQVEKLVNERTLAAVIAAVQKQGPIDAWWQILRAELGQAGDDASAAVRHGIIATGEEKTVDVTDATDRWFEKATAKQRAALLLDYAIADVGYLRQGALEDAAKAYKVDVAKIEREVKAEQKAAAKEKQAAKKAKPAKAKKGGGRG